MDVIGDPNSSLQDVKEAFKRLKCDKEVSLDSVAASSWVITFTEEEREHLWYSLFLDAGLQGIGCLLSAVRCEQPRPMLEGQLGALAYCLSHVDLSSAGHTVILSVVDIVSNACKGESIPEFFLPENYYRYMASSQPSCSSLVVSRACLEGHVGSIIDFVRTCDTTFVLSVNRAAYAHLLPSLISKLPLSELMRLLHAAPFWSDATARYVLVQKMITQRSLRHSTLHKLLQLLSAKCKITEDLFVPLVRAWCHPDFCQRAPVERQLQVTRALLYLMESVAVDSLHLLMDGIHRRMEITDDDVRRLGMCVAERWAAGLGDNSGGSGKLTFDDPLQFKDITDWFNHIASEEVGVDEVTTSAPPPLTAARKISSALIEEDPDAIVNFDEDDSEDDDSLSSYDLDDDRSDLLDVAIPVYARDVLSCLREGKKDANRLKVAMDAATNAILQNPPDLKDCASSLCSGLIHASNEFNLDNFEQNRATALAALVAAHPRECGPYIGSQLELKQAYSIHQQMVMIDSLAAAADRMLGRQEEETPPLSSTLLGVVDDEASRRWGYLSKGRRQKSNDIVNNKQYSQVAGFLFWPSVGSWKTLPDIAQAQLIHVLMRLIEAVAETPEKLRMVRAYLEGPVFCCRWNEVEHTVKSCMVGATGVFISLSAETLRGMLVKELNECIAWFESVNNELSQACLGELARHVNNKVSSS